MTTDPTPDRNDPLRALDAVEPTGNWDDVVSRSKDGELLELAPVSARRSLPSPLLAVAAIVAVVALAGGVFALTRGDDDTQNLAIQSAVGVVGEDGYIWNSTWELVALERNGEPLKVEPNAGTWPQLIFSEQGPGTVAYQDCNGSSGQATIEGDELVVTDFVTTLIGCPTSQEWYVLELLADRPTIAIELADAESGDGSGAGFDGYGIGDRLTLTTDRSSATFERTELGSPIDGGIHGDDPQALWGRTWDVMVLTDSLKSRSLVEPLDRSPLRLDATTTGRLSFNGCNGAGGAFDLDGDRLVVKEIGPTTTMGCPQAIGDQDRWLQEFLEAEPAVYVTGDFAALSTDRETIRLHATDATDAVAGDPVGPVDPEDPDGSVSSPPQPPGSATDPIGPASSQPQGPEEQIPPFDPNSNPAAIWNRTWTVVKITDGGQDRPLVDPADGSPLRLDTSNTSGFAGFNGCNGAGGIFELDGNRLVMTEGLAHRDKLCAPAALMGQEVWLRTFLGSSPIVAIDGNNLTLTTDQVTIDLEAA